MKLSIVNRTTKQKRTFDYHPDSFSDAEDLFREKSWEFGTEDWCYILEGMNLVWMFNPIELDWVRFEGEYVFDPEEEYVTEDSTLEGLYPWDDGYKEAYEKKFGESYVENL